MRVQCPDCDSTFRTRGTELPRQVECPDCGVMFRPRDVGALDDDRPRRTADAEARKRKPKPKSTSTSKEDKTPWLALGIGAGVAVFAVAVIIYFLSSTNKSKDSSGKKPVPVVKNDDAEIPMIHLPPVLPPADDPLFVDAPGRPAPRLLIPILNRTQDENFDPPRLAAFRRQKTKMPIQPDPKGETGTMTLEEIKRATVFIKVGDGLDSISGSGFVVATANGAALIATNCHVIDDAISASDRAAADVPEVTAVFDSGLKSEQKLTATIIGFDAETDLALLRVMDVRNAPRPIDPRLAAPLRETTPVLICGFPFGEGLATGSRSPSVTIGKGSVSSIRYDDQGEVNRVQIDGSLNPGNSGGPIVDADGRLVAIAVATIKGSGIGFSIPADELIAMLDGHISSPTILPVGREGDLAVFQVRIPAVDPLHRVKSLELRIDSKAADGAKDARAADGTWKPLSEEGAFSVPVGDRRLVTAQIKIPAKSQATTVVQIVALYASGEKIASRPVAFRMELDQAQSSDSALPLSALSKNPAAYEGKLLVVRGHLHPGVSSDRQIHEIQVDDEDDGKPAKVSFRVSFSIQLELNDLPPIRRTVPTNLTCFIGKPDLKGITPVYVRRIEFLGRDNKVKDSIAHER